MVCTASPRRGVLANHGAAWLILAAFEKKEKDSGRSMQQDPSLSTLE